MPLFIFYSFTGPIPPQVGMLSRVFYLDFSFNYFSGSIPRSIANMTTLKYFYVNTNLLSGSIPVEFTQLSRLVQCYLHENLLSGNLPIDMGNLTDMQIFAAYSNRLTGRIPSSMSQLGRLYQLFLQSNFFTGPVANIFNDTIQRVLATVDLSSNLLTGELPLDLFISRTLQSFSAGRNCFSGTLPSLLCKSQRLTFLSLDGMNTAANCRDLLFPSFTGITTYTRKNDLQGGIPDCLFNMSRIQTLDLCGIGFQYSFPKDLAVSPTLTDLSLSNNRITGFLPNSIQTRTWNSLDVSYNQLSGTLVTNFPTYPAYSALNLMVNRFSGFLPQSLRNFQNISVLEGNLFYCDNSRSSLPLNDPNYVVYSCGSSSLDTSLIIWCIFFFIFAVFVLLVVASVQRDEFLRDSKTLQYLKSQLKLLGMNIMRWLAIFWDDGERLKDCPSIYQFGLFSRQLRTFTLHMTFLIAVVLLPMYIVLTVLSYNTLTYEFTFFASMAFISGQSMAFAMMAFLMAFLAVMLWSLNREILAVFSTSENTNSDRSTLMSFTFSIFFQPSKANPEAKKHVSHMCALITVFMINFLIVVPFDALYVYATVNYSTTLVDIAQFALAFFKIIWIDFAVSEMMQRVLRYHHPSRANSLDARLQLTRSPAESNMESRHTVFHVFLVMLNNIAFPWLAILVISSNCLRDAIFTAAAIDTSYSYLLCNNMYLQVDGSAICTSRSSKTVVTTFNPPFQYSYQCSSMFITNFTNIYLYMFIMVGFITPALKVGITMLHSYLASMQLEASRTEKSRILKLVEFLVPPLLLPLQDEIPADLPILFDRNKFLVRMATFVSILLTYGVAFGPLAVVICISIFIYTYFEQILIGRLLTLETERGLRGQISYRQILNKETEGVWENMAPIVWIMWPFISLFYAFFVFDTQGSEVGWQPSLWGASFMAFTPLFLWAIVKIHAIFLQPILERVEKRNPNSFIVKAFSVVFVSDRAMIVDRSVSIELPETYSVSENKVSVVMCDRENNGQAFNPLNHDKGNP